MNIYCFKLNGMKWNGICIGLGNLNAFFGRFSRLFIDYFQVNFIDCF
jgi:hypothetical protein